MKSSGKGAVILPHGVLFRGNAEAEIRKNIIQRKWIKGIIGLPANLFYGTGIPACIIVLDKENTDSRTGIFMMDASKGFIKDGNKNRLREQDLHKIVDVFNAQRTVPKFARFVAMEEIEKNEFNLNIPRYIDTQEEEDIQDLNAHLSGGIPNRDVESLQNYWTVYATLKKELFVPLREGYSQLNVKTADIKETIFSHPEFVAYSQNLEHVFESWKAKVYSEMESIHATTAPKKFILSLAEKLLAEYENKALINAYDIYQHLMDYWNETLKDDVYLLIEDGWNAKARRILEKNKAGKDIDKGWTCDLIPRHLVIDHFFANEKVALQNLENELESIASKITEIEEEHAIEEGLLEQAANDSGKITKATLSKRMKEVKGDATEKEAMALMQELTQLFEQQDTLKKTLKAKEAELEMDCLKQYEILSESDIKTLVIDKKWLASLQVSIQSEIDAISQRLTARIKELGERYDATLNAVTTQTKELESKVAAHLQKMGLVWN
jgi:type I restriction enzyme M protein